MSALLQVSLVAVLPPPPPLPLVLPDSSGRASRPGLHAASTWSALEYTTQGSGGLLAVSTTQPRTGGDGTVCDTAEKDCNGHPPAELSTRLCRGAHDAGALAEIDLGTAAVLAAGNQLHMWGWNTRCEIKCRFETPDGQGRVWQTDGGWQTDGHSGTGLYPLDACSGARTLVIRGGGHCGSCRIHSESLRVEWAYAAPPFPPNAAPLPPPPWPPTHEAVAGSSGSFEWGVLIFVGIGLLCAAPGVYNARRGCRERASARATAMNLEAAGRRRSGNGARSPPPPPAEAIQAQLAQWEKERKSTQQYIEAQSYVLAEMQTNIAPGIIKMGILKDAQYGQASQQRAGLPTGMAASGMASGVGGAASVGWPQLASMPASLNATGISSVPGLGSSSSFGNLGASYGHFLSSEADAG